MNRATFIRNSALGVGALVVLPTMGLAGVAPAAKVSDIVVCVDPSFGKGFVGTLQVVFIDRLGKEYQTERSFSGKGQIILSIPVGEQVKSITLFNYVVDAHKAMPQNISIGANR